MILPGIFRTEVGRAEVARVGGICLVDGQEQSSIGLWDSVLV